MGTKFLQHTPVRCIIVAAERRRRRSAVTHEMENTEMVERSSVWPGNTEKETNDRRIREYKVTRIEREEEEEEEEKIRGDKSEGGDKAVLAGVTQPKQAYIKCPL